MKKLKKIKKPNPYVRAIILTVRVNAQEMQTVLARAHGFTEGNIGEWIRYAALNFVPAKKDLQK